MTGVVDNRWFAPIDCHHPDLFHPPAGHPEQASGYPWCEEGWRDLLERMCVRLKSVLSPGQTIRFNQIKEKFAELRVYWRGISPETAGRIMEAGRGL